MLSALRFAARLLAERVRVLLVDDRSGDADLRPCPYCNRWVQAETRVCNYCRAILTHTFLVRPPDSLR